MATISQVTSRPAAAQRLRDLAQLRHVRDRIDREYVQPLAVEALARGVHVSAGHLSPPVPARLRRATVCLSDDVAHRARDGAAAPWRPQRHRGLFRGRCAAQHLSGPESSRDGGDAVVRHEAGDQTDQESRSAGHGAATSLTDMDITIHNTPTFDRDTLGFEALR